MKNMRDSLVNIVAQVRSGTDTIATPPVKLRLVTWIFLPVPSNRQFTGKNDFVNA
jgi:hypothetical protein